MPTYDCLSAERRAAEIVVAEMAARDIEVTHVHCDYFEGVPRRIYFTIVHPFHEEAEALIFSRKRGDDEDTETGFHLALHGRFVPWVDAFALPQKMQIGEARVYVSWEPKALPIEALTASERLEEEYENRARDILSVWMACLLYGEQVARMITPIDVRANLWLHLSAAEDHDRPAPRTVVEERLEDNPAPALALARLVRKMGEPTPLSTALEDVAMRFVSTHQSFVPAWKRALDLAAAQEDPVLARIFREAGVDIHQADDQIRALGQEIVALVAADWNRFIALTEVPGAPEPPSGLALD
jgi:hypothetical protein